MHTHNNKERIFLIGMFLHLFYSFTITSHSFRILLHDISQQFFNNYFCNLILGGKRFSFWIDFRLCIEKGRNRDLLSIRKLINKRNEIINKIKKICIFFSKIKNRKKWIDEIYHTYIKANKWLFILKNYFFLCNTFIIKGQKKLLHTFFSPILSY